jgi:hypothetical protein
VYIGLGHRRGALSVTQKTYDEERRAHPAFMSMPAISLSYWRGGRTRLLHAPGMQPRLATHALADDGTSQIMGQMGPSRRTTGAGRPSEFWCEQQQGPRVSRLLSSHI